MAGPPSKGGPNGAPDAARGPRTHIGDPRFQPPGPWGHRRLLLLDSQRLARERVVCPMPGSAQLSGLETSSGARFARFLRESSKLGKPVRCAVGEMCPHPAPAATKGAGNSAFFVSVEKRGSRNSCPIFARGHGTVARECRACVPARLHGWCHRARDRFSPGGLVQGVGALTITGASVMLAEPACGLRGPDFVVLRRRVWEQAPST